MIAIIAAVAGNGVIGREGKIPWTLPEDMRHFRELTTGNVVVMGRRTYEEIGHPLPGRMNYLISSTLCIEEMNCHTVSSLAEVIEQEKEHNIFICGGRMLYEEALPLADKLYLTELSYPVEGDTYFPDWEKNRFRLVKRTPCPGNEDTVCFSEYVRT